MSFRRNVSISWRIKKALEFYEKMGIIQMNFLFSLDKYMPKLTIETGDDNEILRSVSNTIKPAELKQYRALAESMVKYIKNPDNGGVGLAAPQVGVNKRLIVVSLMTDYDDENYRTIAMVNPEIIEHSEEKIKNEE